MLAMSLNIHRGMASGGTWFGIHLSEKHHTTKRKQSDSEQHRQPSEGPGYLLT